MDKQQEIRAVLNEIIGMAQGAADAIQVFRPGEKGNPSFICFKEIEEAAQKAFSLTTPASNPVPEAQGDPAAPALTEEEIDRMAQMAVDDGTAIDRLLKSGDLHLTPAPDWDKDLDLPWNDPMFARGYNKGRADAFSQAQEIMGAPAVEGLDLGAAIKNILASVRDAANGYHNTQQWGEDDYGQPSYWERIEQAEAIALSMAERLRSAPQQPAGGAEAAQQKISKALQIFDEWSDDDERGAGEAFDVACKMQDALRPEGEAPPTKGGQ